MIPAQYEDYIGKHFAVKAVLMFIVGEIPVRFMDESLRR